MYGVNSTDELIKVPVPAGKHENVRIVEISVGKYSKAGQPDTKTLDIKLAFNVNGSVSTHIHREFPVNRETIAKNIAKFRGATVEEIVSKEQLNTSARIIHIASAFIPKDKLIFQANSWEEYIEKIAEISGTAYEAESFRCKMIYDKRGYIGFPKTTVSPWFQNMRDVDTIVINPKYDNMVPPAPTSEKKLDAIEAEADLAQMDSNQNAEDDLVF